MEFGNVNLRALRNRRTDNRFTWALARAIPTLTHSLTRTFSNYASEGHHREENLSLRRRSIDIFLIRDEIDTKVLKCFQGLYHFQGLYQRMAPDREYLHVDHREISCLAPTPEPLSTRTTGRDSVRRVPPRPSRWPARSVSLAHRLLPTVYSQSKFV